MAGTELIVLLDLGTWDADLVRTLVSDTLINANEEPVCSTTERIYPSAPCLFVREGASGTSCQTSLISAINSTMHHIVRHENHLPLGDSQSLKHVLYG